jgi:hypothetical protein
VSESVTIELSADTAELFAALSAFQAECEAPKKLSTNPHFQSKYANLEEVLETARKPLAKHGLALLQFPCGGSQGSVGVATMLTHKSGQWVRAAVAFPIEKSSPQGAASAITYARRYSAMAALGMAPEDDDAEAAEGRGSAAAKARASKAKAKDADPPRPAGWWREKHNKLCDVAFKKANIVAGPVDEFGLHTITLPVPHFSADSKNYPNLAYDHKDVKRGFLREVLWKGADFDKLPANAKLWVSYLVCRHELGKLEQEAAEQALGGKATT